MGYLVFSILRILWAADFGLLSISREDKEWYRFQRKSSVIYWYYLLSKTCKIVEHSGLGGLPWGVTLYSDF